jgi:hypothetical protein
MTTFTRFTKHADRAAANKTGNDDPEFIKGWRDLFTREPFPTSPVKKPATFLQTALQKPFLKFVK